MIRILESGYEPEHSSVLPRVLAVLAPQSSEAPAGNQAFATTGVTGSRTVEPLNDEDRACRRGLAPTSAGVGDGHVLPRE